MRNPIFIFGIIFLLFACDMNGEKVIDKGPLKVYYSDSADEIVISAFYDFWTKEQYVGERTQSIKITKNTKRNIYEVRIILRKDFAPSLKIEFEELKLLSQIQQDLNTNVFMKDLCELVICDNKFQTLTTPIPLNR